MATWREVIQDALIEIGALESGEPADTAEVTRAARVFQHMLDQWGLEGLLVPGIVEYKQDVTEQKFKYTIGKAISGQPAADIVGEIPETILLVNYKSRGYTNARPIRETSNIALAEITDATYIGIGPTDFVYRRNDPRAEIVFNYQTSPGDSFTIVCRTNMGTIPTDSLDDETPYPLGYGRALRLNLAVELAPSYGIKGGQGLSQVTVLNALDSKRLIMKRNLSPMVSQLDKGLRWRGDSALHPYGRGRRR